MSLEHILDKIIADAKAEAAGIEGKGTEEAERIRAAGEAQAKEVRERLIDRARQEAEERAARLLTLARLEARNIRLAAKQDAIDEAFAAALTRLQQLPEDEYHRLLVGLIVSAARSGQEEIILSPQDRERLGASLLTEANAALAAAGKPGRLTLADETRPTAGGCVLRDGPIEVNCTFETALRLAHDDLVPQVAARLFGASSDGS